MSSVEEALLWNDLEGRTRTNRQKLQADRFQLNTRENSELSELSTEAGRAALAVRQQLVTLGALGRAA